MDGDAFYISQAVPPLMRRTRRHTKLAGIFLSVLVWTG